MRVKNKRQAARHQVALKVSTADRAPNGDEVAHKVPNRGTPVGGVVSMQKLLEHVASDLGQVPAVQAIWERWSSGEIRIWRRLAKVSPYGAQLRTDPLGSFELVPPSFVADLEERGLGLTYIFQSGGISMDHDLWAYLFASRTDAARFWPWPGDQPGVQPGRRGSQGAKPTWDWEAILIEAMVYILENGLPKTQDALIEHISTWLGDHGPGDTQIKTHIAPLFRRAKGVLGR